MDKECYICGCKENIESHHIIEKSMNLKNIEYDYDYFQLVKIFGSNYLNEIYLCRTHHIFVHSEIKKYIEKYDLLDENYFGIQKIAEEKYIKNEFSRELYYYFLIKRTNEIVVSEKKRLGR